MNSGNRLNTFLDASGKISVSVFSLTAPNAQEQFADFGVGVADDMVVVGGGGIGAEFPEGALLTASYPNSDFTGWLVSSKDHERPNPHFLTAYAVGMRIPGMPQSLLNS